MAATRLIALHINKGKSVAQCLADRTDYSQNAEKTNNGEFISSYECDAKTADEEFLLSKRQYQHITGRQQKRDVIAYQIRQSFKPGEITPEEANQVGHELAMRFTKGKHAFIVATHIDCAHIHNHIIYNSTSLDATRKWNNFFFSALAVQRLSDIICLEHGLSVITPKPYRERSKRTLFPKKKSQRDLLCDAIDNLLSGKPKDFQELTEQLIQMGYEFKDGKHPAFRKKGEKHFLRLRSLGEGYSYDELQAVLKGKSVHRPKSSKDNKQTLHQRDFNLLIDIQAKMAEGKSAGYERWAKKYNRKEAAKTVCLLREKGVDNYEELSALTDKLSAQFDELSDSIKTMEKRMVEIGALQTHINNYAKTRKVYEAYRKLKESFYMKKFLSIVLSSAVALSLSATAFAASESAVPQSEQTATTESVSPYIYWTGTASLKTTGYSNITSSNNFFPDSPLVTSDANNPGSVTIRVVDSKGAQVGRAKTVSPGSSVRLDEIPAFSGTYTIQGMATSVEGVYTFNID